MTDTFWCSASEPTGKELERTLFLTFLCNPFCTQYAAANQEAAHLQRKRQRQGQKMRSLELSQSADENWENEVDDSGPLFHIIASLVRTSGVSYQVSKSELPSAVFSPASSTLTYEGSKMPQKSINSGLNSTAAETKNSIRPRSILGTLIEKARVKDQEKKTIPPENINCTAVHSLHSQNLKADSGSTENMYLAPPLSDENEEDFDVSIQNTSCVNSGWNGTSQLSDENHMKHPSQMSREEFLRQFKRAPRRGEIGYDAESVAAAEAVGYVMSGSRNKEKEHYVDHIQRKLHEKEARKLRLQFRQVEDERSDEATVASLLTLVRQKKKEL
ncbi:NF-kappa-B-activating protein [Trypanosoma melophagium]|uniref:NF-kappa-B-activating protein n=1 Tax=Trypanosoma melophagium TaxID=715481 RepID=UPI00351A840D|nr:NF-kappa-B-activating protein [Trypanosoma melophagium]